MAQDNLTLSALFELVTRQFYCCQQVLRFDEKVAFVVGVKNPEGRSVKNPAPKLTFSRKHIKHNFKNKKTKKSEKNKTCRNTPQLRRGQKRKTPKEESATAAGGLHVPLAVPPEGDATAVVSTPAGAGGRWVHMPA